MDNKGFTLSELIVTIALVGVVMAISFPAITKLQSENQREIYKSYEKGLINAAKLYVDKYGRDLWVSPVENATCVKITYNDLRYEDLIKEFDGIKKGEEVDEAKTFVYATKEKTNVTYVVSFATKQGGNQVYNSETETKSCNKNTLPPNS